MNIKDLIQNVMFSKASIPTVGHPAFRSSSPLALPPQLAPLLQVFPTFDSVPLFLDFENQATPSIILHPRDVPLLSNPNLRVEIQVEQKIPTPQNPSF